MSAPNRSKLPGSLAEWCDTAGEEEQKTVLLRPRFSAEIDDAVKDLASIGIEVQSAGTGAITAVVKPSHLQAVSELSWVQGVEEPRLRHALIRRPTIPRKTSPE